MGFSDVVTQLIMFIAVVTVSVSLIFIFNSQVSESSSALSARQKYMSNQIKTSVVIENAFYSGGDVVFYVRNVGSTQLYPNQTSVYIDGDRISTSNLSIEISEDTDTTNTGVFDKGEIMTIQATKTLASDETHQIIIVTQYNGRDVFDFST